MKTFLFFMLLLTTFGVGLGTGYFAFRDSGDHADGGRGNRTRSQAADTPENRHKAAEDYLKAVPMRTMIEDAAEQMGKNFPPPAAAKFKTLMTERMDVSLLEKAMLDALVEHFSVQEIDALADFYGSREGQAIMRKFGAYMADVTPVLLREMQRVAREEGIK